MVLMKCCFAARDCVRRGLGTDRGMRLGLSAFTLEVAATIWEGLARAGYCDELNRGSPASMRERLFLEGLGSLSMVSTGLDGNGLSTYGLFGIGAVLLPDIKRGVF